MSLNNHIQNKNVPSVPTIDVQALADELQKRSNNDFDKLTENMKQFFRDSAIKLQPSMDNFLKGFVVFSKIVIIVYLLIFFMLSTIMINTLKGMISVIVLVIAALLTFAAGFFVINFEPNVEFKLITLVQ